ncbi:MAG: hypothetical protein OEX07_09665, partial [Gammaproteobacteria bacterium]|nr:hypothetical protein [Gammaproteobacteria bacterium]
MKKTILVLSLSFFFFVIASGNSFASSASPAPAKATTPPKTPIDRDLHFSLSGYYVIPNTTPDVPAVKNSQAIAFQLSGAINFFQVGFEYFTVINSPHSYQYKVPYGEIEEHREYDIHSGHIFVRISPWHLAYMTPYF